MLGFPREKESPCVSASPFTSGPREPTSAEYALSTAATSRPPTGSTTSPTTSSTPIPTDAKLGSYIKSQDDWKLVRKYTDNKSGTLDRDGLQRALADARAGLYDILLVYKVDRLARTVRGLAQILDELDRHEPGI